MRIWARQTDNLFDNILYPLIGMALRLALPIIAAVSLAPLLHLPAAYQWIPKRAIGLLIIGSLAWLIIKATLLVEQSLQAKYKIDAEDNLEAR